MNDKHMTDGDRRAEADRIAKARGPAYAEGFQAGLMRAIAIVQEQQRGASDARDALSEELLGYAIEAIGEEVEA